MGHTLVTRFDHQSNQLLHSLMQPFPVSKIPFGRNCDRASANVVLDYHMTVFHWAKSQDAVYLPQVSRFRPSVCSLAITDMCIMPAEEGSWLLYFDVSPSQGYLDMSDELEQALSVRTSRFFHITLAVSKDLAEIQAIDRKLRQSVSFPFQLVVEGLDLYHIWKPVKKVCSL